METAQRIQLAKQRLTALADAAGKAGSEVAMMGPPCRSCRYFERTYSNGRCHNPVNHEVKIRNFDVEIDGYEGIDTMRAGNGLCGPEAVLFERASLWKRTPKVASFGILWLVGWFAMGLFVFPPLGLFGLLGLMGVGWEFDAGAWAK